MVFRIQKSQQLKPKVIHYDKLKPYEGDELPNWLTRLEEFLHSVTSTVNVNFSHPLCEWSYSFHILLHADGAPLNSTSLKQTSLYHL